ncbi:MAG: LytR C-terminal domain-containing protein [Patescibacteria group bacterium]
MAAKHKTTRKTVKRKVAPRRKEESVESIIPVRATVIPNTTFQPVQPTQPLQPAQPIQPIQPGEPVQTVQSVQPMQTVPMSSSSQPTSTQDASSFENSTTKSTEGEPEIKMGTEEELATASKIDGKATDPASPPQTTTESDQNKSASKKNLLLPILVIVLLGIAILGGLFIYRQNFSKKAEEKVNEVSLPPKPVKKPTAEPLDLSKFKIEILNGSGIEGAASSQKSDLEAMGFNITSVGNADNSDYTEIVIRAKKAVDKAFLDKLRTTLEESFEVSEEELDEEATTDIVIIIGSKKEE